MVEKAPAYNQLKLDRIDREKKFVQNLKNIREDRGG